MNFHPNIIRKSIVEMSYHGKTAHLGCSMSLVEILITIFSNHLDLQRDFDKDLIDRNCLFLSKGHGAMALYACLAEAGILDQTHLDHFFENGTELFGLADESSAGVEITGGSLGHGLPIAAGMAYGLTKLGKDKKIYCILGDGEINEGSNWEAFQFIAHHKLRNIITIIDHNKYQAMDRTENILELDYKRLMSAFGFNYLSIDGHSCNEINNALIAAQADPNPSVILAHTIKGNGISFAADDNTWHYRVLNDEYYKTAINELNGDRIQ